MRSLSYVQDCAKDMLGKFDANNPELECLSVGD